MLWVLISSDVMTLGNCGSCATQVLGNGTGAGVWVPCSSPYTVPAVEHGRAYVLQVVGTDTHGNQGDKQQPLLWFWAVDELAVGENQVSRNGVAQVLALALAHRMVLSRLGGCCEALVGSCSGWMGVVSGCGWVGGSGLDGWDGWLVVILDGRLWFWIVVVVVVVVVASNQVRAKPYELWCDCHLQHPRILPPAPPHPPSHRRRFLFFTLRLLPSHRRPLPPPPCLSPSPPLPFTLPPTPNRIGRPCSLRHLRQPSSLTARAGLSASC
jgi:hypothetical protein